MKTMLDKKGFTLIEIIVSIAILGIIAVTFLPVFVTSFKWIIGAGNKSKATYVSQDQAENKLLEGASNDLMEMEITFPSTTPITIEQKGEEVTKGSVKLFIPKY